jgi:hypothetical protein
MTSCIVTKKRNSDREVGRATLASVTKEMARPRFAESAREEEEANHHVAHRGQGSSESRRRGSETKDRKARILLRRALVSSVVALSIGFLGLGVRAFASADMTEFIFVVAFVISAVILLLYFVARRSNREPAADSVFREPPFVRRSLLVRLSAWGSSGGRWILSVGPILSRISHKIGSSFASRKSQMRSGERNSAEEPVMSKPPVSRHAA